MGDTTINENHELFGDDQDNAIEILKELFEADQKDEDYSEGVADQYVKVNNKIADNSDGKNQKSSAKENISNKSLIHNGDTDSSDDEDNRYCMDSKYNDFGKSIKHMLVEKNDVLKENSCFRNEIPRNSSALWKAKGASAAINPVKTIQTDVYTDPVFGIRIKNPLVTSTQLQGRMVGRKAVPLARVKYHITNGDVASDWVIGGVIVKKSPIKTSQKGSQYCIWKLSDLKDGLKTVSVFLFRNSHKTLWKTSIGTVVGILNPSAMDSRDDGEDEATLSVDNAQKVMILGVSKDYGTCKSRKKNGDNCTAFVNMSKCEYCIYHVQQEYKKCSRRSELQSPNVGHGLTSLRNKVLGKNEVFYGGQSFIATPARVNKKQISKDNQRLMRLSEAFQTSPKLIQTTLAAANSSSGVCQKIGNKCNANRVELSKKQTQKDQERLRLLRNEMNLVQFEGPGDEHKEETTSSENKLKISPHHSKSPATSLSIRPQLTLNMRPQLGKSAMVDLSAPIKKSHVNRAKFNAVQWVQRNGPIHKINPNDVKKSHAEGTKRSPESALPGNVRKLAKLDTDAPPIPSSALSPQFQQLLEAKSRHTALIEANDDQAQEQYFNTLEKREKMEEKMLTTFKVNCKAVKCLKDVYLHTVQRQPRATTSLLTTTDNLHLQVERFWQQEEVTVRHHSTEENLCEEHFVKSYTRDATGRFSVRLPLRQDGGELGDSLANAKWNFCYLERQLQRQLDLKNEYIRFLDEYLQLGHMELIDAADHPKSSYYMPHHAVVKDTSSTTKVRVVVDASAKTTSSVSLNELLMIGPTIQQDLFSIVLRFRTHKYALTADIEKMYRQIQVKETDRDLQRIVWSQCPSHRLQGYRLTTVTYGTAAAPYLATHCLLQVTVDGQHTHPTAAEVIKADFYVDDLLTGADTVEGAVQLYEDITSLLKSGGFPIRKWRANNPDILRAIPATLQENKIPCSVPIEDDAVKTLGLYWAPSSDLFQFCVVDCKYKNVTWTKRTVLANVASIYDPLGLLGPVIVQCKLFIQSLWEQQLHWDCALPSELATQWMQIHRQLPELNKIRIPRRVTADGMSANVELHGFADASEGAYGACVYLRSTGSNGTITIHLLSSKSRVAPLRQVSLPRLELNGALLLIRLMDKVYRALNLHISQQRYWIDSTVVLVWIAGRSSSWKTYVTNRVAEIQRLTTRQAWSHVPSQDNPADIISRGTDPERLQDNHLWWAGPSWLAEDPSTWPALATVNHKEVPEQRGPQRCFIATYPEIETLFGQFSSWSRLHRVIAYVLRFLDNVKQKPASRRHGPLTTIELRKSLTVIVRISQHSYYAQEIQTLQLGKTIPSSSKLLTLHPFLDAENLLRVGGRLENAEASFDQKHPMILPPKHHVTKLLIWNEHIRLLHAGSQLLLASMRQRYWITNGRSVVRQVIRNCVTCFKTKASATTQLMGQLPVSRVTASKPFSHCGVDYGGPLQVKYENPRSKTQMKCYIALFVCMCTKAVHIELVSNLTTEAFIAALRRFISRRGRCSHIYSDNDTCFTGAKKKLDELSRFLRSQDNQSVISTATAQEGMEWHLIPPHSPHFGGLWEAGIKSVKSHLRKIAGNTVLTYEEMTTLLTQIETCMNSRPIIPMPSSPDEYAFLTPGHFLIGELLISFPEPDCLLGTSSRLSRWQLVQRCRELIWKRWSADYLGQLQWLHDQPNLQAGRLVLLKEDNVPPLIWPTGIIERTHPGADGLCKYTSFSASDMCKTLGHPLKVTDAVKRFFRCHDCGNRTVSLELIPLLSCKQCGGSQWQRAPMMKERKNNLQITPLSIRGGEEKYLGSLQSDGNLSLLVPTA